MSAALTITQRAAAGVVIVEIGGRLAFDEDGERLLREHVTSLVASGQRNILIDLSRVTHMDSGSVGTLVTVHLHVAKRGGKLKLLCPSDRVCRVLRMTRLESAFEVFNDEAAAVRSFGIRGAAV